MLLLVSVSLGSVKQDRSRGSQWFIVTLAFLDTSHQLCDDIVEISQLAIPEISHLHFARADPENGNDAEEPPHETDRRVLLRLCWNESLKWHRHRKCNGDSLSRGFGVDRV